MYLHSFFIVVRVEHPNIIYKGKDKTEDLVIIWKEYDSLRPASDISHLDYENMTVTYRTDISEFGKTTSYNDSTRPYYQGKHGYNWERGNPIL